MDADATIEALPVTETDMKNIVEDIINVEVPDNVSFTMKSVSNIFYVFNKNLSKPYHLW